MSQMISPNPVCPPRSFARTAIDARASRRTTLAVAVMAFGVLIVTALLPPTARAAHSVSADAAIEIFSTGGTTETANENTGAVEALTVTLPPIDLESIGTSSRINASIRATAAIGALSLFGTYTADSDPGGLGTGVRYNAATVRWHDTATITHETLASGDYVELRARFMLDGALTSMASGNALTNGLIRAGMSGGNVFGSFGFRIDQAVGETAPPYTFDEVFAVRVGDVIPLDSSLHFAFGGDAISGGFSTVTADFANTARFFLTPVTPGAGYVTSSGLSFVPLPAALYPLLGGLAVLGRMRRSSASPS